MDCETKITIFSYKIYEVRGDGLLFPRFKKEGVFYGRKMQKGQTSPLVSATEKICIKLIDAFPNHLFYIYDDNEMFDLAESIRKNGLISPIIVRRKGDRYEMISGHRRKHACELLCHTDIACSIVDASDDEAIIMMVDSNCQRTKILPSERAFAYKMKLEAMKRQGKRSKRIRKSISVTSIGALKPIISKNAESVGSHRLY